MVSSETEEQGNESAKNGDMQRREVPLNEEDIESVEEIPPQQQQPKAKSTVIKVALLAPLCLVNLTVFGAFSTLAPFFATEAQHRGVSSSVIGIVFGSYPLTIVLSSPIFGRLVAKYGPRRVLVCGVILGSSSLFLFGLGEYISEAVAFVLVSLLLRVVTAVAAAALLTSKFSIAMEEFSSEELSTVAGIMESFTGAGSALGPAVGGFLYPVGGYKLPFIVMGFLMASALAVSLLTFHFIGERGQEKKTSHKEQLTTTWQLMKIPEVFIAAMCYFTTGTAYSFFDPVLGPHLKSTVGMDVTDVGLVFFSYAVIYCIVTPPFGWILEKTRCYRCMAVFGFIVTGVTYFLLGPVPFLASVLPTNKMWFVFFTMGANGFFQGVFGVTLLPILKQTSTSHGIPDNLSTNGILSSLVVTMINIGVSIGPTLAGILDEKLGFAWASTIEGLICIVQALLYLLVILFEKVSRRKKTVTQRDEERRTLLKLDSG